MSRNTFRPGQLYRTMVLSSTSANITYLVLATNTDPTAVHTIDVHIAYTRSTTVITGLRRYSTSCCQHDELLAEGPAS